jgi:hypothetical protein
MVKLLTKKHWANGGQSGENKIMGGGGEYTYDGNTYTEHIKYHAQSNFVGKSVEFKSSLEGDLWKISTVTKLDSIQVEGMETWKRIIE